MLNPVTGKTFEDRAEYAESLIVEYQRLAVHKFNLNRDEDDLLASMRKLSTLDESEEVDKVTVMGTTQAYIIKRRKNASYPKERGMPHALEALREQHKEIVGPMVRIEYKESGSKVEKALDNLKQCEADGTAVDLELLNVLKAIRNARVVKEGKPTIEFQELRAGHGEA